MKIKIKTTDINSMVETKFAFLRNGYKLKKEYNYKKFFIFGKIIFVLIFENK